MAIDLIYDAVLLIGNGFDLNCGLKTSYQDVYAKYTKTSSESDVIADFKRDISDDCANWSDFEWSMAQYATRFDSEDPFIECLSDFNGFMHEYLETVQSDFIKQWRSLLTYTNTTSEFRNSIANLGKGVSHNIDDLLLSMRIPRVSSLGYISLNYTSIFDVLLNDSFGIQNSYKPIHIHGTLGDDTVLGMDREEQLVVKFDLTRRVKRHFLKPVFNAEYDAARVEKAKCMIDNAKVVFVYGASLGDSDLSWRELLCNWLQKDKNHHLFLYNYKNSKKSFKSISNRLDYEEKEKLNVISNWGMLNGDYSLDQVHLPCGINPFNIYDAIKKDIEETDKLRPKIIKK